MFAFSPLTWTYAVGAEVFALNNLFAALLLHLLLVYEQRGRDLKTALWGALASGLAMCNQHTIVLFELPIIAWVLWTRRQTLWARELLLLSTAFIIGLLPYVYLPLSGAWNPQPGSWGDTTTLKGLFDHVRRADYGTFRLFASDGQTEGLVTRLYLYAADLSMREVPFRLAFPVMALGVWCSLRSRLARMYGVLLVAIYAFYMVVFHSLSNLPLNEALLYGVHMRFWQQPNVIAFVWLGVGFQYVVDISSRLKSSLLPIAVQACCISLVGLQIAMWFGLCDQSQGYYIQEHARALLDPLPSGAVVFINFDLHWTSIRYMQRCEQYRPDVTVLQLSMMTYHWFATKHAHYPNLVFPGSRLVPYGSQASGMMPELSIDLT